MKYSLATTLLLSLRACFAMASNGDLDELLLKSAIPLKDYEEKVVASGGERFIHKLKLGKDSDVNGKDRHPSFMKETTDYMRNLGNKNYYYKKVYYSNDDETPDDDYFNVEKELSFQGYAMKYATCQKIQRFSVDAVQRGEYSSMITDDVVIMRLCPKKSCSKNADYGCSSGFGEYVMDVSQYMTILMKYQNDKKQNFCDFCSVCDMYSSSSAQKYYNNDDDGNNYNYGNSNNTDDTIDDASVYQYQMAYQQAQNQAEEGDGDDEAVDEMDDDEENDRGRRHRNLGNNKNYNNNNRYYNKNNQQNKNSGRSYTNNMRHDTNTCYSNANSCKNICSSNDDDGNVMEYVDYIDLFGCSKKGDSYGNYYYLSPHCDMDTNTIDMGIFYDGYCNQYAGDEVGVSDFLGNGFDINTFKNAQSIQCIDCSENSYPPYYNANNLFCNNIYHHSGQCDAYLAYDLGTKSYDDDYSGNDDNTDDGSATIQAETQCSFIESIRYGTYDKYGQIYVNVFQTSTADAQVTSGQKMTLLVLSGIMIFLAAYSCMLHHEMTNLLLKSLSTGLIGSKKRWVKRRKYEDDSSDESTQESGSVV